MLHISLRQHPHPHIQICIHLLVQQLECIGNIDLRECCHTPLHGRQDIQIRRRRANVLHRPIATRTYRESLLFIENRNRPAAITDYRAIPIGPLHNGFLQKAANAVAQNRITFHLANAQPTLRPAPSCRLVCPLLPSPLAARIPLVLRHMLQTHRIHVSNEHLGWNELPAHAIVHQLLSKGFHPQHIAQNTADRLHRIPVIHKQRPIPYCAQGRGRLTHQRLDKLRHRHTRRNGVGIHDHIYRDSLGRPRHVVAAQKHANGALLAVPVRVSCPNNRSIATN